MNEQVFLHLLEVYGADIRRWPVEHQAAAAQYASSPAARHALLEGAALDRLLADCAPIIDDARTERLIRGMDARLLRHEGHLAGGRLPGWVKRWGINRHLVYAWLFILGCLANLLMRFLSAEAPLDLLFSNNLLLPLGG